MLAAGCFPFFFSLFKMILLKIEQGQYFQEKQKLEKS